MIERELTRPELRALALDIAHDESAWRHLARHDASKRTYEEIVRGDGVGIWVICWMDDHDTGFHDHDISSGAVAVVQGLLREDRMTLGAGPASRVYGPGEAFDFAASDIHRMAHAGGGPAISIHVYSPPLWRMGAYAVDPEGVVSRASVSYAEELRPLDDAAPA